MLHTSTSQEKVGGPSLILAKANRVLLLGGGMNFNFMSDCIHAPLLPLTMYVHVLEVHFLSALFCF